MLQFLFILVVIKNVGKNANIFIFLHDPDFDGFYFNLKQLLKLFAD